MTKCLFDVVVQTQAITSNCINELGDVITMENGLGCVVKSWLDHVFCIRALYFVMTLGIHYPHTSKKEMMNFEKLFIVSVISQWQFFSATRFSMQGCACFCFQLSKTVVWYSAHNWICILFGFAIILRSVFFSSFKWYNHTNRKPLLAQFPLKNFHSELN